jgi:hypothetical protein
LPEKFLGRTEELQAIKDKLFAGNHLLHLVNGEGGIGKTSLASHYYHTYQTEYAHVAWLLSEKNIANALLTLAGPLALQFEDTMPPAAHGSIFCSPTWPSCAAHACWSLTMPMNWTI